MYHIPKDARATESASRIAAGLLECARSKPFSSISIADIHAASGVSRSTFYRLFDNTSDVLRLLCDQTAAGMYEIRTLATDKRDFLLRLIERMMSNTQLLQVLEESRNLHLFEQAIENQLEGHNELFASFNRSEPETIDYTIRILAAILAAVMGMWVRHGRREDAHKVLQRVLSSIKIIGRPVK